MGASDPDMKENLRRRYGKPAGIKAEVDHMVENWAPQSVNTFRERLDDFIRRTADRFLGENRSNPEKDLYSKLQKDKAESVSSNLNSSSS